MQYRRGFKSEAKAIAHEIRTEIGLGVYDPLNPHALAEYLDIPVIPLSDYMQDAPKAVVTFAGSTEFSATTVFHGTRRVIVHNDSHTPGRQANNLSHEVAHGLLHHRPTTALDARGCRIWDESVEKEAEWLGGVLLVTDEAAVSVVRQRIPVDVAAERYGVSRELMQMRINLSGATKRASWSDRTRTR